MERTRKEVGWQAYSRESEGEDSDSHDQQHDTPDGDIQLGFLLVVAGWSGHAVGDHIHPPAEDVMGDAGHSEGTVGWV